MFCSDMIGLIELNNTYDIKTEEKIRLIEMTSFTSNQKQELKNKIRPMDSEMTDTTSNVMISDTQEFNNASIKLKFSWLEKSLHEKINTNSKIEEFQKELKQQKEDSEKQKEDYENLNKQFKESEIRNFESHKRFQHNFDKLSAELNESKLESLKNERERKEIEYSLFGIRTRDQLNLAITFFLSPFKDLKANLNQYIYQDEYSKAISSFKKIKRAYNILAHVDTKKYDFHTRLLKIKESGGIENWTIIENICKIPSFSKFLNKEYEEEEEYPSLSIAEFNEFNNEYENLKKNEAGKKEKEEKSGFKYKKK